MIEKRERERSRNGGKKRVPYRVAERKIKRRKKKECGFMVSLRGPSVCRNCRLHTAATGLPH